jgi:hypothetical protein
MACSPKMNGPRGKGLFGSLAQGASGRLERYSTDCVAWLLAHDPAARCALLDLFASKVDPSGHAARVLATLRDADAVEVETETPIAVSQRSGKPKRCRLDLRLIAGRHCVVVEIKVDAPSTMHRDEDEDEDDGPDVHAGAAPLLVPQTRTYRRWLDEQYGVRGALFVLTSGPEPDLAAAAHGAVLWQELHGAFRDVAGGSPSLVSQFCDFLEGRRMAKRTHPGITAATQRVATDATSWAQLSAVLDETVTALHAALAREGFAPQLKGQAYLGMLPDPEGLLLWHRWVKVPATPVRAATWFTPYLYVARPPLPITASLAVSYFGMTREQLAGLVDVDFEPLDNEFACSLEVPTGFDALATASSQAGALVDIAMSAVVRPVLARSDHA